MTIHRHMPFADYQRLPGINASRLKLMQRSPLHYLTGDTIGDTPGRELGRLVHSMVLEPDTVAESWCVYPGGRRYGKAWDEWQEANPHMQTTTKSTWASAQRIADAVLGHPTASRLLAECPEREVSMTWTHRGTGQECKGRPDAANPGLICDIKVYGTTELRAISRKVAAMGAHIQAAHYVEGWQAHNPARWRPRFVFIVCEGSAPYDVRCAEMTPEALDIGAEVREGLLQRVAECQAAGSWPGRSLEIDALDLPMWADPHAYDEDDLILTEGAA